MQALRVPLWLAKDVTKYAVGAIFMFLMLGYGILTRQKRILEQEQVLHKLQRQNEKDLKAYLDKNDAASKLVLAKKMNNETLVKQMEMEQHK